MIVRAIGGGECWSHHVAMNGLPASPKKVTERIRPCEIEECVRLSPCVRIGGYLPKSVSTLGFCLRRPPVEWASVQGGVFLLN